VVQTFNSGLAEVQQSADAGAEWVQWCKNGAMVQRCSTEEVQRCRGAEVLRRGTEEVQQRFVQVIVQVILQVHVQLQAIVQVQGRCRAGDCAGSSRRADRCRAGTGAEVH